jgi:hypothetical protein
MTAHELLIAARAMIPTPNDWTKGVNARDADGDPVDACDPNAVCYCAEGTMQCADAVSRGNGNFLRALAALSAALPEAYQNWDIHEYQDLPETTHADVLALFDRAIAATAETA